MGLFSWLFPSAEDRLARARKHLADGRHADARMEALDLDLPGAAEVIAEAEAALCQANLDAALSWAKADDPERVNAHMEVAADFATAEQAPLVRDTRRQIREIVAARQAEAQAAAQADTARLFEIDDRFLDGRVTDAPPLPPGVSPEEAEALRMRLSLWMDAYPEPLRGAMLTLGPSFAQALVDLDEGRPEPALQALLALPDDQPLVQHERARAALALGDPPAAARSWRRFAELAGGHQVIGQAHTAVLLADVLARTNRREEALTVLREHRTAEQPRLGGVLYALLLESKGDLAGAETELRALIKASPKHQDLYVLLARVRVAGGHRVEAMQALEASLQTTVCTPGTCGFQPPHLATHRLLATLYFEDGRELPRAVELAETAASLVRQPTWEDAYLAALHAKHTGDASAQPRIAQLMDATPGEDPRHARAQKYLTST